MFHRTQSKYRLASDIVVHVSKYHGAAKPDFQSSATRVQIVLRNTRRARSTGTYGVRTDKRPIKMRFVRYVSVGRIAPGHLVRGFSDNFRKHFRHSRPRRVPSAGRRQWLAAGSSRLPRPVRVETPASATGYCCATKRNRRAAARVLTGSSFREAFHYFFFCFAERNFYRSRPSALTCPAARLTSRLNILRAVVVVGYREIREDSSVARCRQTFGRP